MARKVNFVVAAMGRCPFCLKGKLFSCYLKPSKRCDACGEDFTAADPREGPVIFVILFAGFIACGGLMFSVLFWDWPPYLVLAVWPPVALIASLVLMPILKALMIAFLLKNNARIDKQR